MFTKLTSNFRLGNNFNKFAFRGFKSKLGFKEQSSSQKLGLLLTAGATAGMAYLMWQSRTHSADMTRRLISSGSRVSTDISLKRTRDTLVYFSGSLVATSAMVAGMLRSPAILRASSNWMLVLVSLPVSFFCMYKMHTTPNTPDNNLARHLYWLGLNASVGFSLVPLIYMSELLVVRDAFLLTSGVFGGLGMVAYNSRDDAFLGMSGILGAGLGGIAVIGLANMFLQSNALFNIWLYAGLALFTGMVLYDLKEIQNKAKRLPNFDPMTQSIGIYLDFINIFVRILMILQNRKNK